VAYFFSETQYIKIIEFFYRPPNTDLRDFNNNNYSNLLTKLNREKNKCYIASDFNYEWKKRSEGRKHCTLAVVRRSQKFRPAADPLPGLVGRPKFNQLEMVTTFTYRPSLVNRPTNKQTGPVTRHCSAKFSAKCNETSLCGRDGRTICGPQCVPKSTSVTLAVDEKTLSMATITGWTDRQTDRQTECDAICGPS